MAGVFWLRKWRFIQINFVAKLSQALLYLAIANCYLSLINIVARSSSRSWLLGKRYYAYQLDNSFIWVPLEFYAKNFVANATSDFGCYQFYRKNLMSTRGYAYAQKKLS